MAESKLVLVTGSAGGVGLTVCVELTRMGYLVFGFDRLQPPGITQSIIGEITDRLAVSEAMAGKAAVIHLALTPDEADFFNALIEPNVRGLFHVCDASRKHGRAAVDSRELATSSIRTSLGSKH